MTNLTSLLDTLTSLPWQQRLAWLGAQPGTSAAFSTSFSLEDQAITHVIATRNMPIRVFTLDTGRMFEQTYATFQRTRDAYPALAIETYYPDSTALEALVARQGINGFYDSKEARLACCHVRKVEPLERALKSVTHWISGLRREHSDHRADLPVAEMDSGRGILKLYPLIDVEESEIRAYIDAHRIPYNSLHDEGFPSIGCAPCTRAVAPGEHPRSGRWWWESEGAQECGLHLVDGKLVRKHAQ